MKKVKFYSAVALVTLSASLLTACSSTKNTIPENTFAQSTKVSTSEKKGKTSMSSSNKASNQSSSSKANTSKVSTSEKSEEVTAQVVTESSQEVVGSEAIASLPNDRQVVTEQANSSENTVAQPENQEVVQSIVQQETEVVSTEQASGTTQAEIEALVKKMIEEIPSVVEQVADPNNPGIGVGAFTSEYAAELEKQGYWEKLNQAFEDANVENPWKITE